MKFTKAQVLLMCLAVKELKASKQSFVVEASGDGWEILILEEVL